MSFVKGFLDSVGSAILWLDFAIQGIGVLIRFLIFSILSWILPFCGRRDFEFKHQWRPVPPMVFSLLWLGGVFLLFWSTAIWPLLVVLTLEFVWGLYALVNGNGERRREIFFHTAGVQFVSLILFFVFIGGTGITNWREIDHFQHHGDFEAWLLIAFLVLRVGLFPFHVNRLDVLCEISRAHALCQTIFNSWIIFQTGLLMKAVGFMDAFGDWSSFVMGWCVLSILFALGLSAVQERPIRLWAHLYWILGHIALYLTTL